MRTSVAVLIVALAATACSLSEQPKRGEPLDRRAATGPATTAPNRFDCPGWAQETVPERVRPYLGRFGLPDPYPQQKTPLGGDTAGIDLWQANHFVAYHKDTAEYLYRDYSPTTVAYRNGTLPSYERLVARYTAGCTGDRQKALALLKQAMPKAILHPSIPPYGPMCPPDRAAGDEELLKSGKGWCNEQARVFARLCQVAGIPARIIFLFYSDKKGGHVIAEFHADGRWCMADSSWCCVFPDAGGRLMSAAECHLDGPHKLLAGKAYWQRVQEVLAWSDELLIGAQFTHIQDPRERARQVAQAAERARTGLRSKTAEAMGEELWAFGVMNYPLPP